MRSILILFVLVLTSCTRVEPKMTVISNKEKFVIENFAKSVTAEKAVATKAKKQDEIKKLESECSALDGVSTKANNLAAKHCLNNHES